MSSIPIPDVTVSETSTAVPGEFEGPALGAGLLPRRGFPARAGARLPDDRVVVPVGEVGLLGLLEGWEAVEPRLRGFDPAGAEAITGAEVLAPLRPPAEDPLRRGQLQRPPAGDGADRRPVRDRPLHFHETPHRDLRRRRAGPDPDRRRRQDRLGGRARGRRQTPLDRAFRGRGDGRVAGYVPFNDITDRSRLERANPLAPPFRHDWLGTKAGDGSGPIGSGIVPAFLVGDPQALRMRLWVSGRLKQDSSTADMLHRSPS